MQGRLMLAPPERRGLVKTLRGRRHYWVRPGGRPPQRTRHAAEPDDPTLHEAAKVLSPQAPGPANQLRIKASMRKTLDETVGHKTSLTDIQRAFTPPGLKAKLSGFKEEEPHPGQKRLSVEFDLQDQHGKQAGFISRVFNRHADGTLSVYHDLFELNPEHQNKGHAKNVLAQSFKLYERVGVHHVSVTAVEIGKYTWASIGFRAGRVQPDRLASLQTKFINYLRGEGLGQHVTEVRAAAKDLPEIADLHINGRPVGREFLLSKGTLPETRPPGWSGELRIDRDDPYYQRARRKVGLES